MGNENSAIKIQSLRLLLCMALALCLCGTSSATNTIDEEALKVIADFADLLCNDIPLEGTGTEVELSGSAKAELSELIKKIANLGIEGAAKYQSVEYSGLLQKDLAKALETSTNCKLEIFRDLKDGLVSEAPKKGTRWMPSLGAPRNGTTMRQNYLQPWRFSWDDPSVPNKVRQYHLRVFGSAPNPLIDVMISGTEYTRPKDCGYITVPMLQWQVRAEFEDGEWGPWADPWGFDIPPYDKRQYCQQCPDSRFCKRRWGRFQDRTYLGGSSGYVSRRMAEIAAHLGPRQEII